MRFSVLVIFFLLFINRSYAAVVYESNYNSGMIYYAKSDYKNAMAMFKENKDDERSLYMIGVMYEKGEGVKQDYAEAAKWYSSAAEKGVAAAMYKLGKIYEKGLGVEQNREEAVSWYKKGASKGDYNSITALKKLGEPFESKAADRKPKKK